MIRSVTRSTISRATSRVVGGSGGGTPAPSYDSDAQTYFTAVEAEDGEALESGVKDAINAFVVGCKADGIWSAIKASCILAGARTLDGALVPLVGAEPTSVNFVSGDYSRTAGLLGNASTKYLLSGRLGNSDPQDNMHRAVYLTADATMAGRYISSSAGLDSVLWNATGFRARVNSSTLETLGTGTTVPTLVSVSRSAGASYSWRGLGESGTQATASTGISSGQIAVFAENSGVSAANATIAFYSIGESLDLALLDSRVSALIAAIGVALA
jgi:hypothetical protein